MKIEDFVPATKTGMHGIGFVFGAGTSFESGYPLIAGLTNDVISALKPNERVVLDEVLSAFSLSFDSAKAQPNIEEISDLVIEQFTNSRQERFKALRERIRELIRQVILDTPNPDISNQVKFFECIRSRTFDLPTDIWIFTTNYDLLFEDACTELGLRLVNGFSGATTRYFSEQEFSSVFGRLNGNKFSKGSELTVRLVKLHGSVSWFRRNGRTFETAPRAIQDSEARCMVLPRRTKVLETLTPPYDRLFSISTSILGDQCKYLISSGFSFGDTHINDALIAPKIASKDISLFNFCESEPQALMALRQHPNVTHFCADKIVNGGQEIPQSLETWKFSEFVNLF